jgi:tetratricopeptide (TPR) repeat protein
MLVLGACGGSSTPTTGKPTVPSGRRQTGSVVYTEQKGGFGGDEDVMPMEQPKAPEPEPEPSPTDATGAPRPPTQDLPPEKRDAMVTAELRRGVAALRAHDADGTVRAARAALDLDESNVEAMIMLAHGYYMKQYDDKVEAVLTLAGKQKAGQAHPVLWMLLGLIYDRTNREDLALQAYEKATQLKPDYLAALNNKGAIYLKRKRYADAIPVFEQVVQIDDKSARAHTNLGSAYRGRSADLQASGGDKGQRDQLLRKAEAEYKLASQQDPSYAPAYFDMGILYLDADPFPGLETLARLQQAQKLLSQYKQTAGPNGVAVVDDYITAAQKGVEREQKLLERKKRKEAEKRDKESKDSSKEKKK